MRQKPLIITLIIAISLFLIIFFVMKNNNKPPEIDINIEELNVFAKKIAQIELKVVDLTNPNDLLNINEFNELVKQVSTNYNIVYSFISDNNKPEQQKYIAIYALRGLDFEGYLNFFEKCLLLYQKKQLSDNVIMTVLSPGSNWNCTIVQNYKNKKVIRLLESNLKYMSEGMKEVFKSILSGEMWASIEDERNWSQAQ
ncbi:MAG: hypothetical protein WBH80_04130 [Bacteroidales bacterium]|mgnify:FL=1|jgi:hypothetical protein